MHQEPISIRLATLLIALVCCGSQAYACTCAELTVAQQRENAATVFLGTVITKSRSDAVERSGLEVTLGVERVWKGNIHKKAVVYTGATGDLYPFENLCAPLFRVGQKYIVFAFGEDKLTTDVCAGTLLHSKYLVKQLGKSARPQSNKPH